MIITAQAISDKGLVRPKNEDHILVQDRVFTDDHLRSEFPDDRVLVFAVADGLGGHPAGDVASRETLRHLHAFVKDLSGNLDAEDVLASFEEWVAAVHDHLIQMGKEDAGYMGMGTTVCGLLWYDGDMLWFHAGDSRLYHFGNGDLKQVTADHSQAALMNDPTIPSSAIANCIGPGKTPYIDTGKIEDLSTDDSLLLCSDGLSDMLNDTEIQSLMKEPDVTQMAEKAKKNGGLDNISAITITFNTSKS